MTRDFTVAVFVVWRNQVLLHPHRKLGLWLPPGGHIETNELPDEAATREVFEEAGLRVMLEFEPVISHSLASPVLLTRPRGVQLEEIGPGHQHIDLVYFARPSEPYAGDLRAEDNPFAWYGFEALAALGLSAEVLAWCELALRELA